MASFRTADHVIYIVSDLKQPAFRAVAESLAESRMAALWDFFTRPAGGADGSR
jgi:hypothetical protein